MNVTPKLHSLEALRISQLSESSCFGNGTHILIKNWDAHFLQYIKNEKII